ncbi:MAG: precorrin-2 C(20)-methyltransferase [Dehalococcoidales bacterium]|nr:precorrin-2 C(20)-methyltransferase [Dehalococcoidales bacterium]
MTQPETTPKPGTFYGIGAGPGDPELLTIKALRVLSEVPVVFVPVTKINAESLAGEIVNKAVPGISSKFVPLLMPMHRDIEHLEKSWNRAASLINETVNEGRDCAFINVGDPFLYGTFIYVLEALKQLNPEVNIMIIPGVSSVNAASARAAIDLATGNESVAILSGYSDDDMVKTALEEFNTTVFLKAGASLNNLYPLIEESGLLDNCVYIRRCSLPEEEIITNIRSLKNQEADYFSIMIVRK